MYFALLSRRFSGKVTFAVVAVCMFWCATLWKAHSVLDSSLIEGKTLWQELHNDRQELNKNDTESVSFNIETEKAAEAPSSTTKRIEISTNEARASSQQTRYIMFRPIPSGQGAGNQIHGLLAAHMLGEEFDRVVCVQPAYKVFHYAFRPLDPRAIRDCPTVRPPIDATIIELINFHRVPPDECEIQRILKSSEQIIVIVGNTYPRWSPVPDGFFKRFYAPTPALQATIPWKEPPTTVVHLRRGDHGLDKREGLDTATLEALGKTLPSNTFLVTNNVIWFDYFSDMFNWTHPEWRAVQHSAAHAFIWGKRGEEKLSDREKSNEVQSLQMWSDWWSS